MNALQLKAELVAYLHFKRKYPLVCIEQFGQDVVAVDTGRRLMWVEIKVSMADLLRDRKKRFHQSERIRRGMPLFQGPGSQHGWADHLQYWHSPARFFFAVPQSIVEKASSKISKYFPWAGLICVRASLGAYLGHHTNIVRKGEWLHDRRLDAKTCVAIVRAQSATLAHVLAKQWRAESGR